jgi:CheY-like chemotaxis protein
MTFDYSVVTVVASGEEALAAAESDGPDLVVMDISLAGKMDGIETARQIQANMNIPVVFLTGQSDPEVLERAKQTKPFGFVLKPLGYKELITTIESALQKFYVGQRSGPEGTHRG